MNKEWLTDSTALGGLPIYGLIILLFIALNHWVEAAKLVIGFALFYLIVQGIRSVYFKHRPEKQEYHTFKQKLDASSFPSLHAARVTFLAATLILFFNNVWVTGIFTAMTVIVYATRIALKRHDIIDVVGGVVVGAVAVGIVWLLTPFIASFF